jgi:hypothetical protein
MVPEKRLYGIVYSGECKPGNGMLKKDQYRNNQHRYSKKQCQQADIIFIPAYKQGSADKSLKDSNGYVENRKEIKAQHIIAKRHSSSGCLAVFKKIFAAPFARYKKNNAVVTSISNSSGRSVPRFPGNWYSVENGREAISRKNIKDKDCHPL